MVLKYGVDHRTLPRKRNPVPAKLQRMRERRIALDLTQEEVGEMIGCSGYLYHRMETGVMALDGRGGKRGPKGRDYTKKLARALGMAHEELLF